MTRPAFLLLLLLTPACALKRQLEETAERANRTIDQGTAILADVQRDYRATVREHDLDRDGALSLEEILLGVLGAFGVGKAGSSLIKRNAASDQRKAEIEKAEAVTAARVALLEQQVLSLRGPKNGGTTV